MFTPSTSTVIIAFVILLIIYAIKCKWHDMGLVAIGMLGWIEVYKLENKHSD